MAKLSYRQRQRLPDSAFALEKERKYPLTAISHARNALARVVAFGTPAQIREVRREVYKQYPELKKGKARRIIIKPVKSPVGKQNMKHPIYKALGTAAAVGLYTDLRKKMPF